MATSTHPTVAAIDNEISFVEKRLAALREARDLLAPTQTEEASNGGSEGSGRKSRSSKSTSTKSESRKRRVVVEDTDEDDNGTSARRRRRLEKARNEKSARASKKNGQTKTEQIKSMLDKGMSPREIADELDMKPNYVYHVKRQMAEQQS